MSLSRPVKFPLLRLPFLCMEPIIKNWNIVDIVLFALISQKTRQIVKHLKIPLSGIKIFLSDQRYIELGIWSRKWDFWNESRWESHSEWYKNTTIRYPFVLQKNAIPMYTSKFNDFLDSYSDENAFIVLKMAMEFLNEVFKCSVERVCIDDGNFPESGDIGVKSVVNLCIYGNRSLSFGYAQSQKLSLLLENLEVTDTCNFWMDSTEKDFYVDPKLFKCKKLEFGTDTAAWVTREILLQFEVAQLVFSGSSFSVEDILAFVTNWFHSDNKKLEYLYIINQRTQFSLEDFRTTDFSWRNLPSKTGDIYFPERLEIVRHDGSIGIIDANGVHVEFSVCNKKPAITQH
ncbi:unnamed protein product [Caenorhabditis brenneri]